MGNVARAFLTPDMGHWRSLALQGKCLSPRLRLGWAWACVEGCGLASVRAKPPTHTGGFPWQKEGQPTPEFLPGKSHGQRSLAGYSPWSHRVGHDWVTNTHTHTHSPGGILSGGLSQCHSHMASTSSFKSFPAANPSSRRSPPAPPPRPQVCQLPKASTTFRAGEMPTHWRWGRAHPPHPRPNPLTLVTGGGGRGAEQTGTEEGREKGSSRAPQVQRWQAPES